MPGSETNKSVWKRHSTFILRPLLLARQSQKSENKSNRASILQLLQPQIPNAHNSIAPLTVWPVSSCTVGQGSSISSELIVSKRPNCQPVHTFNLSLDVRQTIYKEWKSYWLSCDVHNGKDMHEAVTTLSWASRSAKRSTVTKVGKRSCAALISPSDGSLTFDS